MIKFYNTLSRKKELFKPLKNKIANVYTCGPTVYNYAHIGNLRTYIFEDILQRTLEYDGYKVNRVMNITDVGHLTSDADTGEDKLDKEAHKKNKSVREIAVFYTKAFLDDLKKLNVEIPKTIAPATEYIKDQIELIEQLFKKGYAYDTPSAVYFDVSKFKKYGKLSGQSLSDKIAAARKEIVIDYDKKNSADFALWFKLTGKYKNHLLRWSSPWGKGFPGWHIECSAISKHFLGQPFDIHTGGVDHIGTHHENEIAQSEAAYNKPLANTWMHGEFLIMDKEKMAKSKGNFLTLSALEKRGYSALVFRYFILGAHYRKKINFTWQSLESAQNSLNRLYNFLKTAKQNKTLKGLTAGKPKCYDSQFADAINDDLNTPKALSIVWKLIKDKSLPDKEKKLLLLKFDKILGLKLKGVKPKKTAEIPQKINDLAQKRELLRNNKQFIQADALRKQIEKLGYLIEDIASGPIVRKKS
ncbi:MAG: cysteine--tRNA ligase [Spirochaetota bacterium]